MPTFVTDFNYLDILHIGIFILLGVSFLLTVIAITYVLINGSCLDDEHHIELGMTYAVPFVTISMWFMLHYYQLHQSGGLLISFKHFWYTHWVGQSLSLFVAPLILFHIKFIMHILKKEG